MSEKFCLKWNDFDTNVTNSFRKLRTEDDFYDVTLVSSDYKQVSAHRLVLSTCSDYFRNILTHSKHSNPLLCLEGITSNEISQVLDYIYNGELQIYQENLERFLQIAQRFQLEGLIGGENNFDSINKAADVEEQPGKVYNEDVDWKPNRTDLTSNQLVSELGSVVTKSYKSTIQAFNSAEFQNIDDLDQKIRELMDRDSNGMHRCTVCNKVSKHSGHIREHMELHFEGLSFPCSHCEKEFRSRHSLRSHLNRDHK